MIRRDDCCGHATNNNSTDLQSGSRKLELMVVFFESRMPAFRVCAKTALEGRL
jgi:hypothetical protein